MRIGRYIVDPDLVIGGESNFDAAAGKTSIIIYYQSSEAEYEKLDQWASTDKQVTQWMRQIDKCIEIHRETVQTESDNGETNVQT